MIPRMLALPKNQHFFLFGPRQTGKSTLLKSTFQKETTLWYDLLKTDEYTRLIANPHLFREEVLARSAKISHVVVDEIQRVPDLLNEIHWLMEEPNFPYFIITGSSARKLKRSSANLLAGRAFTYSLFPLTKQELDRSFQLERALAFGTLPSIFLESDDNFAIERLRAYTDTYLKEEIEQEVNLRNIAPFIRFLTLAANENGNQINYSNIAKDTGVSYQTIKSYFQILEDTLIGQFLLPYAGSERQRLSKQPKFYFFDTGVVRALKKTLTVKLDPHTSEYGKAFEHFIFLELVRRNSYLRLDYNFTYYRSAAGAEVDIIIETPKKNVIAIEIKTGAIDSKDLHGVESFKRVCPNATAACVTLAPNRRKIRDVTIIPWQELFTWIEEVDG